MTTSLTTTKKSEMDDASSSVKKHESKAFKDLRKIVDECKRVKGNSYGELSEIMENLKIELGVEILKQKFQQKKTVQTADKIHHMSHNFPNILKTIYHEDKMRMKEQSEDEMAVLKAFEMRKVDTKYFQMLEKKR